MKRVRVLISGRVQGVFFRAFTRDAAIQRGVTGWVRNLVDGRVEAAFEGSEEQVDQQMLGEVARDRYITSSGARIGDALMLTKGIAIEGTAILAKEKREDLHGVISEDDLDRCAKFLYSPGISVVRDARLALEIGGVHAMHELH